MSKAASKETKTLTLYDYGHSIVAVSGVPAHHFGMEESPMLKSLLAAAVFSSALLAGPGPANDTLKSADGDTPDGLLLTAESVVYGTFGVTQGCGGCHTDCYESDEHGVPNGSPGNAVSHGCYGPAYCPTHPPCNPDEEDFALELVEAWENLSQENISELRDLVASADNAWFNAERGAIQFSLCGVVSGHLPLSDEQVTLLLEQ